MQARMPYGFEICFELAVWRDKCWNANEITKAKRIQKVIDRYLIKRRAESR